MTGTLADMKTRIADEIMRSDLTNQIALAISETIAYYQQVRYFFNESDSLTFNTVIGQSTYAAADQAQIPTMYAIDDLFVTLGINEYRIKKMDPSRWHILNNDSTRGQPYQYAYYNRTIRFYPIPGAVYPMRITGHYKLAAPANDAEENNPWMVEAEAMVRHWAEMLIWRDVIQDVDQASIAKGSADQAELMLLKTTSSQVRTGQIAPMQF